MMNRQEIIDFFDRLAPSWDEHMVIDEEIIEKILTNARLSKDKSVLDVACGTGVMIPFYLKKGAASVTAIDLSPKMCEIAESKFDTEKVQIVCDDVLTHDFKECFDCIVVYNALPHFDDPCVLIRKLTSLLNEEGTLSIAHGMSREKILAHHSNVSNVSRILPKIEELQKMMEEELIVTASVSDDRMYQIVGIRK